MSNNPIKILVHGSFPGCNYWRLVTPHMTLKKYYPNDFEITILDKKGKIKLDDFDILIFNRYIGDWKYTLQILSACKRLGVTTILDIDDHWENPKLPKENFKGKGIDWAYGNRLIQFEKTFPACDYITTSTSIFRSELLSYNKNIEVFPNAIDPDEKQWQPTPEESDRVRVGWLGSSGHINDINLLKNSFQKLHSDTTLKDKYQLVLCGFDTRGAISVFNEKTGLPERGNKPIIRQIKLEETAWYNYEQVFTKNYNFISDENDRKKLLKYKKRPQTKSPEYNRVWSTDVTKFANNYNLMDIALAPLDDCIFNKCKSQLKVLEAGFHKKAIIAQDFGPYNIDCVSGKNSLLVPTSENQDGWYKHIKTLINNPNMVKDLGEQLYEDVQKYNLKKITKDRAEWYKSIIKK